MAAPLLTLQDIGLGFGGPPLLDGVTLSLARDDRVCLVGRNGSGKSTLLKIAAGLIEPDRGERTVQSGCRIAYLPQEPDLAGFATVTDYVAGGLPAAESDAAFRVDAMLDAVKLDGARTPASLSGGEARRAALARALVGEPDVLLLDEPTNHLDIAAIEWLEAELAAFRGAFILVSHDRAFLDRLTRAVLWLDRGVVRRLDEGFAAFEAWSEDILRREEVERAKLDKLIADETRWSHQGITARRRRNQGRLRRLHALRAERARQLGRTGSVKLQAESGLVSGRLVVEAEAAGKAFDGRTVVRDFSTRILRGDRIGIIGPNGAGKTTLLRLLIGDLAPDTGRVRLGTNLAKVYLDQRRAGLDAARTLWETLCESGGDQVVVRGRARHVVGYLRDFLFEERQAKSPVGSLSGGERNRLLLAKALARPSNVLALDEPTNDLDMDTLDLLQEMLADYDGTLLLVSHDRDFLDRVVTSTIVMAGDGRAVEYAGGYSDYLRQRPQEAARPEPERARAAKPAPQDRPAPKRPGKLSYKQQRALEALPARIAALEGEIAALEGRLGDAALYARDPDAFRRGAARLEAARAELAAAEEEWLELELLRETLTAGGPEGGGG